MKNYLLSAGGVAVAMLLLVQSGVANATMMFLLTGAIPGTGYTLPPLAMLVIMATGFWLFIAAISQKITQKHITVGKHAMQIHRAIKLSSLRNSRARS